MVLRVGINGFGRIGRVIFRTCLQDNDLEVAAINDPAIDIEYICYLLKFDSTHGKLNCDVTFSKNEITIKGNKIKVFREKLPSNIPWQTASVQYVVEASGMFTNYEKASGHLSSQSVKRVLVTAPSVDVPMLIIGVNEDRIKKDHRVVSCASSTLYCLAPIIKILEDNYQVVEGFITSIHAMTPSLKPLDGLCLRGKHWRDHRSIHQNIIPAATGACKALGKIIPAVKDKLTGLAFRVPIVNVSVLDITIRLNQNTSIKDIVKCIDKESRSALKNIIKSSYDEAVSSDFLGDEKSCILDVNSSLQLNPNFFKLICWYENEYSYACRVVDSIKFLNKISQFELVSKMTYTKPIASERIVNGVPIPFYDRDYNYCNSITRNNSRMSSMSQNNGFKAKLPQRHVCPRQPLSLPTSGPIQWSVRETKKQNNDILKLWKDNEKIVTSPQKQRSSYFQSCIALGPSNKERTNYLKTQVHLEEVKREFSRMIDMTQNLLKKSKESTQLSNNSTDENMRDKESTDDCSKTYSNSNSLIDNYYQTEGYKYNDNAFDSRDAGEDDKTLTVNNKHLLNECEKVNKNKSLEVKENNCSNILEKYVKTLNNKDILEINKYDLNFKESSNYLKYEDVENSKAIIRDDIEYTRNCNQNIGPKLASIDKSTKVNEEINENESEIRNIYPRDHLQTRIVEDTEYKNIKDKICSTETANRATKIKKKIIEGLIKKLSFESSVETSHSPSPGPGPSPSPSPVDTNTTISVRGRHTNDIYDKLDSTSATDSDNSFQVNEKKSEVIEITDLTSSAEDLARLDKICRIIEISDELSDKLFSALDNKNQDFKKKKWSFKDLCENIKLDDFCNKLFGQSTSK